ncbi:MAG: PQQ-dependent sugar dehydrogenase [Pirellulales bacterium]
MKRAWVRLVSGTCCLILAGLLSGLSGGVAAAEEINQQPLAIQPVPLYPNLRIQRPVLITNAGDGSGRLFVVNQLGKVLVLPEDRNAEDAAIFLDIEDRVQYKDTENEEGLLGLAFHPKFKENGQLFVYYTARETPRTSVVSRFRLSKEDPNRVDPASEEQLLRIQQPFWNHNGGTLAFGPDGFLYIGMGDGGAANDPFHNGQNVQTLLGKILRIDVDRSDDGKPYGIPADNPFAQAGPLAKPEIWAYGFRNIWRMSFDPKTGTLWAADVGQDLWEEINIVRRGGNYGWNLREGKHAFGPVGAEARPDLIDPIWEYHHDVGKSITGGNVYRGTKLPELDGAYLFADYVSGRYWALWYDAESGKVTANRELKGNGQPIMTFGAGEDGEVYCADAFGVVYGFEKSPE